MNKIFIKLFLIATVLALSSPILQRRRLRLDAVTWWYWTLSTFVPRSLDLVPANVYSGVQVIIILCVANQWLKSGSF